MKLHLLFAVLLGLAACSTQQPISTSVPAARRFQSNLLQPSSTRDSALRIVREQGVKGAGVNLYLDGGEVVRLGFGETITLFLAPGRHVLSVRPLFSPAVDKLLILQPGKEIALRLIDQNGNFELKSVQFAWLDSIGRSFNSVAP